MKVARPHLAKLDPRRLKVVFIGYKLGSKAYRLYDPAGGQAHVSRDVIFNESTFWQWNDVIEADHNPNQFTVEYLVTKPKEGGAQCHGPTFLVVRCCDLDTLTTSLERKLSPIYVFCLGFVASSDLR